jgi:hypothetical protein
MTEQRLALRPREMATCFRALGRDWWALLRRCRGGSGAFLAFLAAFMAVPPVSSVLGDLLT